MRVLRSVIAVLALSSVDAFFGKGKKKEEEEDPHTYKNLAKDAMKAGAQPGAFRRRP